MQSPIDGKTDRIPLGTDGRSARGGLGGLGTVPARDGSRGRGLRLHRLARGRGSAARGLCDLRVGVDLRVGIDLGAHRRGVVLGRGAREVEDAEDPADHRGRRECGEGRPPDPPAGAPTNRGRKRLHTPVWPRRDPVGRRLQDRVVGARLRARGCWRPRLDERGPGKSLSAPMPASSLVAQGGRRRDPVPRVLGHRAHEQVVDDLVLHPQHLELRDRRAAWAVIIWKSVPAYGARPVTSVQSRQPSA